MKQAPLIKVPQNGDLASKLRSIGLGAIVDSSRVRRALGIPVHLVPPNAAKPRPKQVEAVKLPKRTLLWHELQALRAEAIEHKTNVEWQRRLAFAEAEMGNFSASVEVWDRIHEFAAVSLSDRLAKAAALHQAGELSAMRETISEARSQARGKAEQEAARWGLGGYYQSKGDWDHAAGAYADELAHLATSVGWDDLGYFGELSYRTGLSLDRCYLWSDAEKYYRAAIYITPEDSFRVYKLALSLERQEKWAEAAETYLHAVELSDEGQRKYRRYRAAFCLNRAGDYKASCEAFLDEGSLRAATRSSRIFHPPIDPSAAPYERSQGGDYTLSSWLTLAAKAAAAGDDSAEAEFLESAIGRATKHPTLLFEQAGLLLFKLGDYSAASAHFIKSRLFQCPDGIDLKPYRSGGGVSAAARYAEYRARYEVERDVFFFESFHGAKVNCHPLAIFKELLEDPRHADATFVWSIRRGVEVPDALRGRSNVVVAERGSDLFLRYLATASHLVTNVSLPEYFVRRSEQRYLNTWHGTPVKSLGKDIRPGYLEHTNVARNFLQATHLVSTCSWMTDVYLDKYDVREIFTGRISELGSPRSDVSLKMTEENRAELRSRLGVSPDEHLVLYAPTWRGTQGNASSDVSLTGEALAALAEIPGVRTLFRGHHYAEAGIRKAGLGDALVPEDIDTNDLLAIVDTLVTDYSSVFFDFLPFNRPIIFLVPDEAEYRAERGLYFEVEELPGTICRDTADLPHAIASLTDPITRVADEASRKNWATLYAPMEDGHATKRAISFFLEDDDSHVVSTNTTKPLVLLRSTLLPNGITTSARNLVSSVDPSSVKFVNIVDTAALKSDLGKQEQFDLMPSHVAQLGRAGAPCYTPEERWIMTTFNRKQRFLSTEHRRIARAAYAREFERIAGSAHFNAVVEFDGYAGFWANLLSSAERASRKAIYQHNDLYAEWTQRFPSLEAVFSEYPEFDEVVSISPSIRDTNRGNLAERFGVEPSKFTVAHNQINPREVFARAEAPVDDDILAWLDSTSGHTFVTMGRLSVEKAQDRLLRALALVTSRVDARLIIIGSGVLMEELVELAHSLGISDRVLFTGQRLNPMGILRLGDTFVMSSAHEGQPMVIGEALMLGLPVISTDLPGCRDLLSDGKGVLVPHDTESLAAAMHKGVLHGGETQSFDAAAYEDVAINEFARVCGTRILKGGSLSFVATASTDPTR